MKKILYFTIFLLAMKAQAQTALVVEGNNSVTLTVQGSTLAAGTAWRWYKNSCTGASLGEGSSITIQGSTLAAGEEAVYYARAEHDGCSTTGACQAQYRVSKCPYTAADLVSGSCAKRRSGAQNWQLAIQDSRDGNPYRVVLMPGSSFWFAENLRYANGGVLGACSNGDNTRCATPCGRWYTATEAMGASPASATNPSTTQGICPTGWRLPSHAEHDAMLAALTETTAPAQLTALKSNNTQAPLWAAPALAGADRYGFSMYPCGHSNFTNRWGEDGYLKLSDANGYRVMYVGGSTHFLNETSAANDNSTPVRCVRS